MIKQTLKLSLLGLSLFGATSFAKDVTFTAAHLTNNFTRENLQNFTTIGVKNPADCNMAVDFVGTKQVLKGNNKDSAMAAGNEEIGTKDLLEGLDQIAAMLDAGQFKELRNSADYPIPECANNAIYTLSK